MATSTCPICKSSANGLFIMTIQAENQVELNSCSKCEFAFYPDQNWINQSFSDVLNSLDAGAADRTVIAADYLGVMLKSQKLSHGKFLDYGGGYGLLSRIMRDRGFNFENFHPRTNPLFQNISLVNHVVVLTSCHLSKRVCAVKIPFRHLRSIWNCGIAYFTPMWFQVKILDLSRGASRVNLDSALLFIR
jgi:hypothetical protein